jgi:DNA mismatch endonuclease (patch repair protein)
MAHILPRGNERTELALVRLFRRYRIVGWRRHVPVFGNADFVFRKQRVAVFVDGCFWHGCPKHASTPASNRGFWRRKLERNKIRDRLVNRTLSKSGWRVVRVWQHELIRKNEQRLALRIRKLLNLSAAPEQSRRRFKAVMRDVVDSVDYS